MPLISPKFHFHNTTRPNPNHLSQIHSKGTPYLGLILEGHSCCWTIIICHPVPIAFVKRSRLLNQSSFASLYNLFKLIELRVTSFIPKRKIQELATISSSDSGFFDDITRSLVDDITLSLFGDVTLSLSTWATSDASSISWRTSIWRPSVGFSLKHGN